jgi:hypothetical protein
MIKVVNYIKIKCFTVKCRLCKYVYLALLLCTSSLYVIPTPDSQWAWTPGGFSTLESVRRQKCERPVSDGPDGLRTDQGWRIDGVLLQKWASTCSPLFIHIILVDSPPFGYFYSNLLFDR